MCVVGSGSAHRENYLHGFANLADEAFAGDGSFGGGIVADVNLLESFLVLDLALFLNRYLAE